MTNTPTPANEPTLPLPVSGSPEAVSSPAAVDAAAVKPRPRFGRGPLVAGIIGGVLALGIMFGGGVLVGHFVVPAEQRISQSERGFSQGPGQGFQGPGQNGQRPHRNGNQPGFPPGADGNARPDVAPTAAPAS